MLGYNLAICADKAFSPRTTFVFEFIIQPLAILTTFNNFSGR